MPHAATGISDASADVVALKVWHLIENLRTTKAGRKQV
jgi:hypothetical protein